MSPETTWAGGADIPVTAIRSNRAGFKPTLTLTDNCRAVLGWLIALGPHTTLRDIADNAKLSAASVGGTLIYLGSCGLVERHYGGRVSTYTATVTNPEQV